MEELIDELHTTTLRLKLTDAKGRRYTKSGPLLSDVEREDDDQAQAELGFEFSPAMRRVIANSTHWAVISRRAVMAFESRYALRLYTVLSLRAGLRKAAEEFTVEDLSSTLYVFGFYAAKHNACAILMSRSGGILSGSRSVGEC
jgi:hypothetical protein